MEAVNSGRNGGTERENGLPCHVPRPAILC
jgi:hypothetical protein